MTATAAEGALLGRESVCVLFIVVESKFGDNEIMLHTVFHPKASEGPQSLWKLFPSLSSPRSETLEEPRRDGGSLDSRFKMQVPSLPP